MRTSRVLFLVFLISLFVIIFVFNIYLVEYQEAYEAINHRLKVGIYLLFLTLISSEFALLEIQIEGKHGWAQKLPTKLYNGSWWKKLFAGKAPTGYHLILMLLFLPTIFHLPFFFTTWDLFKECIVLGSFFFFIVVEDFMWFVFNPEFGLKKFNSRNKDIWWHNKWFGLLPDYYLEGLLLSAIFLSIGLPHL